jgi:probable F420-dependent oxidoreductase
MNLGRVGIWSMELREVKDPAVRAAATELDALGFGALWIPGLGDKLHAIDRIEALLGATSNATVALGVQSIWGQSPADLAARLAKLPAEQGARALIGLGVSSRENAEASGANYDDPVKLVSSYLSRLASVEHQWPADQLVIGALGPKMAELAATQTRGLHPFLVTPTYSANAREALGAQPVVAPHLAVVLETDTEKARDIARNGVGFFIGLPAYQSNLRRLGFGDDDLLVPGGSDRLIDGLVAHGGLDQISMRIDEHLAAGATHVALHVLQDSQGLPLNQWRALAQLNN